MVTSSPAYPLVQEGLRHQRADRATDAASCYERALELDPKNFDALQFLGVVRFRNGDCASGIALIEQALALHPSHPSALNNLGNALRAAGRLGEAVAAYRRAVALSRPPRALFLRNLGSAQLEIGEWAEAAGNLRCASAMAPTDSIGWCWMGHLQRALQDPQGALDAYGKALALDPGLPEAHRGMACVFRDSDQPVEARAAYGRVLELAPEHLLARLLQTDLKGTELLLEPFVLLLDLLQGEVVLPRRLHACRNGVGAALHFGEDAKHRFLQHRHPALGGDLRRNENDVSHDHREEEVPGAAADIDDSHCLERGILPCHAQQRLRETETQIRLL